MNLLSMTDFSVDSLSISAQIYSMEASLVPSPKCIKKPKNMIRLIGS